MDLTATQKQSLLNKIQSLVTEKYFDPSFDEARRDAIVNRHRSAVIDAGTTAQFEARVSQMLAELTPKSLALLSDHTTITPRNAINASFTIETVGGEKRWVFQDVLSGGIAAKAGARPGDVLLNISGRSVAPTAENKSGPQFEMQKEIPIVISRSSPTQEVSLTLGTPEPKYKDNPYAEPTALYAETKPGGIDCLKVSPFPGKIGIDFANQLDAMFGSQLKSDRLIIDLRGNPGGGIGGLTLMSYLTPERLPIGYSKNRKMALEKKDPSSLPIFDKVTRSKLVIPLLAVKFLGKTSVFLYTEGIGRSAHKGRTVILVNEHTTGAAEIVAQFAQQNGLATIVGAHTPGRLVSRSASKLGFGYRLVIPVAAYVSANGSQIEGNGITPNVAVPWSFEHAVAGRDSQMDAAVDLIKAEAA